jgi:3-isopropylmalate dehydrogenase
MGNIKQGNMRTYNIATVPGDGIGPEVLGAAIDVLNAAAERGDFNLVFSEVPISAHRYLTDGVLWSDEIERALGDSSAILVGAVGDPAVPPGVLERGIIVRMRDTFRHSVNVRPVVSYDGVRNPFLRDTQECDLVIVRENTEGAYASAGTVVHRGTAEAVAVQESINTYAAIARALKFGLVLAQTRRRKVTVCHKTNIMVAAGNLWMQVLSDLRTQYPDVDVDYVHVDAMGYHLMTNPGRFDVIVTDNLFGDIISDVAAVLQGGLGLSASANVNLDGRHPSMFEPVHGSAPDIAGQGVANPIGAVLSGVLCLAQLGEVEAATVVESATACAMRELTGQQSTREIKDNIQHLVSNAPVEVKAPTPLASLGHAATVGVSQGDRESVPARVASHG